MIDSYECGPVRPHVCEPEPFPSGSPTTPPGKTITFSSAHVARCCILSLPRTYRNISMDGSGPSVFARADAISSRISGGKFASGSTSGCRMLTMHIVNSSGLRVDGTTSMENGDRPRGDLKPLAVSLVTFCGARVVCCDVTCASCGGIVCTQVGEPLGTLGGRCTGEE